MPDSDENGQLDVNFSSLEQLLSTKLESLQALLFQSENEEQENRDSMVADSQDRRQKSVEEMSKARIKSDSTSVNDILFSLRHSRAEVSSLSREILLAQMFKLIVTRPIAIFNEENAGTKDYVGEAEVADFTKSVLNGDYRSPTEFILMFRSMISLLVSDLDDFGEIVNTDLFVHLERLILDPPNANVTYENKANVVSGYCGLLLVLYNDTSAFGIDDKIKWLMEIAQGFVQSAITLQKELDSGDREYSTLMDASVDENLVNEQEGKLKAEADIAVAALHGIGALLTLLPRGDYLNDLISTIAPEVVEVIDNDVNMDLAKAAARLLALFYESYTYETVEDEDDGTQSDEEFNYNAPYYEQGNLLAIFSRLANQSTKRIGKKGKKEVNSVFKEVANTVINFTNKNNREEIYKRSPTGLELLSASTGSTTLKLSRSKSISINSWFLYFRLLHLKWCFGFGLHDQLVSNSNIRSILKEPATKYQSKYNYDSDDGAHGHGFSRDARSDVDRFSKQDKKRDNDLKKARENKISKELEQLELK